MGNWLTRNQAQELVNAASKTNLCGWRDGAMLGLLLGGGLRRSEVVGLNLDQLQSREGRWVIVNLVGKGKRLRTTPVTVVEQGASRCLAPAFGSYRGKGI
jgi:integrase/recombinase XerD